MVGILIPEFDIYFARGTVTQRMISVPSKICSSQNAMDRLANSVDSTDFPAPRMHGTQLQLRSERLIIPRSDPFLQPGSAAPAPSPLCRQIGRAHV